MNLEVSSCVILSGTPAKNFRPTSFVGRADAKSKDPYSCEKLQVAVWRSTSLRLPAAKGFLRLLATLVAQDDTRRHVRS